jgi:hypothetical protein
MLLDTQITGLKNHKIFDVATGGYSVTTKDFNLEPAKVTTQSAISYDHAFSLTQ